MSRFINPAIVSPFEMGIVEKQPSPNIKRGLMLMSKILQNIANHVEFSKEAHMQCFNDFVRSNFEQGRRFFIQVVQSTLGFATMGKAAKFGPFIVK